MTPRWLQQVVMIWIGGTILAFISSKIWFNTGETNVINALASFNTINIQTSGGWGVLKGVLTFFDALYTIFVWDYPFLASDWAVFIKIPLWLVSIGTVWGMITVFLSVVQGIAGTIRSLITPG